LGLGCGTILLISKIVTYGQQVLSLWRFWLMVIMVLLTLIFSVYLQPEIAATKELIHLGDLSVVKHFDTLHAMSKNLYILISLLGLALVVSSDKQVSEVKV
jgi:cellulose synthase/poly-beta-1,6-N-acetylglucosamine synthase-like glycosyltransferase